MIFRKVALERLSSPEQLDQMMTVTDRRGWVALVALGLLLVAALGWGVFGSIPTTAAGQGILLRQGGIVDLEARGSGQVEALLVTVGERVERGQVVARIRQEGLLRQIADSAARRDDLALEIADLERYAGEQMRLTEQNLAQQRANLLRTIETLEQEGDLLGQRLISEEELLASGLVTKQTVLDTRQALNAVRDQVAGHRLEIDGLPLERLESRQQLDQQLEAKRNELRDHELEVLDLTARLEEDSTVVSPHDGRVLELLLNAGDVVAPGTSMLSMEVVSEELIALLFVPAAIGKKVQLDMEAQIVPSTVQREEYGYMLGRVTWVAEFPSTSRGMTRLLANEDLVSGLMEDGPPIEVRVALERAPETPTGYRWSSTTGPELAISSGTLAAGSIVVERHRPIALVVPRVREKLGL